MISSTSNAQVKAVAALVKKAKARREQDLFVVEGIRMFREIPAGRLHKAYVSESFLSQPGNETLLERCPWEAVKDEVFKAMSDTQTPQGILALVRQYHYRLEDILEQPGRALLMVLETLQDPGNLGTILREDLRAYRDELVISTKAGYEMWAGPYGNWGSRKSLLASLDQSLRRLGLDYVDIFYHHRMDPETPLEETMGALQQAVASGKALYAGLSNYDGPTMERAARILSELHCPFVINQNRYSIFDRTIEKNGLKAGAQAAGKGIIAFSPLAQGLLTGRYLNGIPADSRIATDGRFLKKENLTGEKLSQIRALHELAVSRGESLSQLALSWVMRDGAVTSVLVGASRPEQIVENLRFLQSPPLGREELERIDAICGL